MTNFTFCTPSKSRRLLRLIYFTTEGFWSSSNHKLQESELVSLELWHSITRILGFRKRIWGRVLTFRWPFKMLNCLFSLLLKAFLISLKKFSESSSLRIGLKLAGLALFSFWSFCTTKASECKKAMSKSLPESPELNFISPPLDSSSRSRFFYWRFRFCWLSFGIEKVSVYNVKSGILSFNCCPLVGPPKKLWVFCCGYPGPSDFLLFWSGVGNLTLIFTMGFCILIK